MPSLDDYAKLVAAQTQARTPRENKRAALDAAWELFYETGKWPNARWQVQGTPVPCRYMIELTAERELKRFIQMATVGQLGDAKPSDLSVECMIPPRPKEATQLAFKAHRANAEPCPVCPALAGKPCIDSSGMHVPFHATRRLSKPQK